MTKNKLNTGDLWFNPNEPEKLAVFKKNKWEKFTPELSDYLGERVTDRLRENGGALIGFNWDSYRKNL